MQERVTAGMAVFMAASMAASTGTDSTVMASTVAGSSWSDPAAAGDRGGGDTRRLTILRRPTTVRRRPTARRSAMRRPPRRFRSPRRNRRRTSCSSRRAGTSCAATACRRHTAGSGSRTPRPRLHRSRPRAHCPWLPRADHPEYGHRAVALAGVTPWPYAGRVTNPRSLGSRPARLGPPMTAPLRRRRLIEPPRAGQARPRGRPAVSLKFTKRQSPMIFAAQYESGGTYLAHRLPHGGDAWPGRDRHHRRQRGGRARRLQAERRHRDLSDHAVVDDG